MKTRALLLFGIVTVLFAGCWIWKAAPADASILDAFYLTTAAFLTLAVFSFLYGDNPVYKFAEHLYVGISAAYWMCLGFWSNLVQDLIPRTSEGLSKFFAIEYRGFQWHYIIPLIFGILLLMRLSKNAGWLSRWSLAFLVGATAGLNLPAYLTTDFLGQISNTFIPLIENWRGAGAFFGAMNLSYGSQLVGIISNCVVVLGTLGGIVYFFFSKEHRGLLGVASRFGIWVLMLTFGAAFGYTVMGRVSLLVGRLTFIFRDFLGFLS